MKAVTLGGRDIWLRRTASELGLDPSYLSKVLSGAKDFDTISVGIASRIATVLEFSTIEDLKAAIEARRMTLGSGGATSGAADSEGGEQAHSSGPVSSPA